MPGRSTNSPEGRSGKPDAGRKSASRPSLVIVESPAKAKTIARFLGPDFVVESSIGHIRDLPSKASEIPPELKNQLWARIGVDVENDFRPLYVISARKKAQVSKLRQLVRKAGAVLLATDEDREGEAIAWHLKEVLDPRVPVKRMVFDEITRQAIQAAVQNPRDIDMQLVDAQEARRILDRLYGYEVSPVLWRKIGPGLSAGRVQSVATRLIVDRERERMQFVSADYWDIEAVLCVRSEGQERVNARLVEIGGKRVATGKDFDDRTGAFRGGPDTVLLDEARSRSAAAALAGQVFKVTEVTEKPFTQRAHPPFITSTLQQEAARKLRYSVRRTMQLAQELYENGYITYMRTDSTHLSEQAINAARRQARELYGPEFCPEHPRHYATRSKGAQEAHEAIRPAGEVFRTPAEVRGELHEDAFRLYDLIWKRTIACQMKDAVGRRTSVRVAAEAGPHGTAVFGLSGKVITLPGFLRAYVEGSDTPEADLEDQERVLPPLAVGQELDPQAVEARGHTTQPPPRYTEATLIRELEERGIGRPSTYASIIQTIQDRQYVWKKGTALVPTFTAFAVIQLLETYFADLVDFNFTAKMETDLDAIASGDLQSRPWLRLFYFGQAEGENGNGGDVRRVGLHRRIQSGGEHIDARAVSTLEIGRDPQGRLIVARIGKYGPYLQVGEDEQRVNLPADLAPDELTVQAALELLNKAARTDQVLGVDPEGRPVYLKNGRFGPYVQLGDAERTGSGKLKKGGKPRMASLWPSMSPETLTLEQALKLLSFPRVVGRHPESGEEITVQDGKYGPYVKCGRETRSLESHEQLETLDLPGALAILAQPKGGRRRAASQTVRGIGLHPVSGAELKIKDGRFGPYVTDGVVNASLPKGMDPATLTPEKAAELLAAREERLKAQGKDPRASRETRSARQGGRRPRQVSRA